MAKCNKHLTKLLALLVLPVFIFTGCLKEGDDTIVLPLPNGKIPYDVIPERIQDSLTRYGFVINEGVYPPSNIEGKYVASPMDIQYASDNYHNPNFRYLYMAFAGQQRRGKINYSQVQYDTIFLNEQQFTDAIGDASRAHVIGEDSNFTMYCIQTITIDPNCWCSTASVVSGTLTKAGIKNCQYAEYILDKQDDPNQPRLSEVGTYRIWNDGDGFATKIFTNPSEQ
jgi:hypothetical protein